MALPNINTYDVNKQEIALYWKASPKSSIKKWNVYGSATAPIDIDGSPGGVDITGFSLIQGGIANRDTELTPGSVYARFSRDDLGIGEEDTYYFLITSIDKDGNESAQEVTNLHGVPAADDYYVDEAGEPTNIVYKSFEFIITADFAETRYLDMISLLGRPARSLQVKCDSGSEFKMKLNSFNSDTITVLQTDRPLILERGGLEINRLYVSAGGGGATSVRIMVAA